MLTPNAAEGPVPHRGATPGWFGKCLALVPLILVNLVAISGQLAFLRDHLSWSIYGDVAFAAALESVAVYLAYHAHIALISNDSALRLRLGSYAFGVAIGAMNYNHYAGPHWRPDFQAVAVGLMSASSPWLWGIHSRRQSRAALIARGLIEPHALRLGMTRWVWHPVRSFRVMFQSPATAIAAASTGTAKIAKPRPELERQAVPVLEPVLESPAGQGPAAEPGTGTPELEPVRNPGPEPRGVRERKQAGSRRPVAEVGALVARARTAALRYYRQHGRHLPTDDLRADLGVAKATACDVMRILRPQIEATVAAERSHEATADDRSHTQSQAWR